jgi:large subunit ribosomal protein L6
MDMSRIGKLPIIFDPSKVSVEYSLEDRNLKVTGPLGSNSVFIHPLVNLEINSGEILVSVKNPNNKLEKSIWGTTRSIINNLVYGVINGFTKQLDLNGVGFRMELKDKLILYVGFSHPVELEIPKGIDLKLEKNTLKGSSVDKQLIGDFFASVHDIKPCDPYKQKGFRFPDRYYIKKEVKKSKS